MKNYQLKIKLLSDTTFGRGDGVAGLVDQEVEHDRYGFPYLRGRTLKGLLSEECDNIIQVLPDNTRGRWEDTASQLFGTLTSTLERVASVHIGDACLLKDVRQAVAYQIDVEKQLTRTEILEALTTIRRQTAIAYKDGTPVTNSLRSSRAVIRDLCFTSDLIFESKPTDDELALLAVGTLALRHIGSGRNRGKGHVQCCLWDDKEKDITQEYFQYFVDKENSQK